MSVILHFLREKAGNVSIRGLRINRLSALLKRLLRLWAVPIAGSIIFNPSERFLDQVLDLFAECLDGYHADDRYKRYNNNVFRHSLSALVTQKFFQHFSHPLFRIFFFAPPHLIRVPDYRIFPAVISLIKLLKINKKREQNLIRSLNDFFKSRLYAAPSIRNPPFPNLHRIKTPQLFSSPDAFYWISISVPTIKTCFPARNISTSKPKYSATITLTHPNFPVFIHL